ncbi:hypothetical protein AB0E75_16730 [Streptomyces griseoviridis]|uniref:Uncharacterized protein n=1 Tax=Streptomyces griseoviridis TaxID=45398 RepID=A0A918GPA2_STRGD|nr:hypothetical protein [Streptomyces niveoruber]GGS52156.1 hypothetical protein GCM10010238_46920 [Streptomyces niveoruber]
MPLAELSPASSLRPFGGADDTITYPVDLVLSLHRGRTAALLRALRSQQVFPTLIHGWGDERAYSALLHARQGPLTVLDVPDARWDETLAQRVRALSKLSSVVVLTPEGSDPAPLLLAGAANVMSRTAPARELASRIAAERRWLDSRRAGRGTPGYAPGSHPLRPRQSSQALFFDMLCLAARPWCCHELRLLLGPVDRPMSRRALQARIARLDERLGRAGLYVNCSAQWGRTLLLGLSDGHHSA